MVSTSQRFALLFLFSLAACSGDDDDSTNRDAGTTRDGGPVATDGGTRDAGADRDGGPIVRDAGIDPADFPRVRCADFPSPCVEVPSTSVGLLLDTTNTLEAGLTIVLGRGAFELDNAVTIRGASGVTLTGQGIDVTTLDFSAQAAQSNGVDVVGDDFTISDLTIDKAKKDGLRVEDSENVEIRRIKVTWSDGPSTDNGAYGIYPVKCTNVLIEDSEAYNAADAGIYVGQTIRAVVRRNIAMRNVAGIEIENTQYAEVYENTVEDNTGGLLVFDLPGNPIVGHDVRIHDNTIVRNNRDNFAASGTTVSQIPAGTGTFVLASRRIQIDNNTYEENDTTDIAVLSGLAFAQDPAVWRVRHADLEGSIAGLVLPFDATTVSTYRTEEIRIHDNAHSGSGTAPDAADPVGRPIGALLGAVYGAAGEPVDPILYDGIGETVAPTDPSANTNDNRVCLSAPTGVRVATLDLANLFAIIGGGGAPTIANLYRPDAPFVPYDCDTFTAGPILPVELGLFDDDTAAFPRRSCDDVPGTCVEFEAGEEDAFLDAINALADDTTVILGRGVFLFDNAVTIRGASGVTLAGQGKGVTVLDFGAQVTQSNGVDVVGDDFTIHDLTLVDAKKDALRIEDSVDVVIRRVEVTWSAGPSTDNGAYGIYPVKCQNVLVEDTEAYNAADAGLYIGQVVGAVVRQNFASGNVAGLEVENTQYADVYANHVTDNTGGLLIFDLPGNPIVGRDVRLRHNYIERNNRANFARSMTIVARIPAGTGTFALASRRVEIFGNTYLENDTTDIALLSGFVAASSSAAWAIDRDMLVGSIEGLDLLGNDDVVYNFRTEEIFIHDNLAAGSGTSPDAADPVAREIGALLAALYFALGNGPVDNVLYDGIGEVVDPNVPENNTNRNHICMGPSDMMSFAALDIENLAEIAGGGGIPSQSDIYQPASPFVPFDCAGFTSGPIVGPTLR